MIQTSRLLLRVVNLSDAPDLFELNRDPEVMRFTGDTSQANVYETEAIIRNNMIPDFERYKTGRFLIFRRTDGVFLGWCGLKYFPDTKETDLGYRIAKRYWGLGYASESARAALTYGFHHLGLERIIAKVMPDNQASIRVLQKLGMTFKGFWHDPTDPVSFLHYELRKSDFVA